MSIKNLFLFCLILNFIFLQNLHASDNTNKFSKKLLLRGCEGLEEEECFEAEGCEWLSDAPNNFGDGICIEVASDGGDWNDDGGWENLCSDLSQDECVDSDVCDWTIIATPNGIFEMCVEVGGDDGWNDDGGWPVDCLGLGYEDCESFDFCEWIVDDTTPDNVGSCVNSGDWNDDGGWESPCSELSQDECVDSDVCDWAIIETPNGIFEMCVETGGDDGWNDDGGWDNMCFGLGYEDCEYFDFCEWIVNDATPDGIGSCVNSDEWNDCDPDLECAQVLTCYDGFFYPTTCGPFNCDLALYPCDGGDDCEGLGYDECMNVDSCEWIGDGISGQNGSCVEAAGPNPCSDFGQEDCEWFDECVWTDDGCQDYNWNDDCDPDLICGQALTCFDGLLYPTTCGPANCDEPIDECDDQGDDGGNPECEGLSYEDCEYLDYCEWITDSNDYTTTGTCIEVGDDGGDGPPECVLDCEGIENINPDEDPYEACDWIITLFGFDPGFSSCTQDCDEETMMFINQFVAACYDCLYDTTLDCADVFDSNEECSDLNFEECVDAEDCEPNFDAAGQFEGCQEDNNQDDGCYEDGEFYCYGCELFISDCEYLECTEDGWSGPFTLDNDECSSDHEAVLKLVDVVGIAGSEVVVPLLLHSTDSVGGVQFSVISLGQDSALGQYLIPSDFISMDDCFTASFNNVDGSFIGIIFSLEGCDYPANETVHIADLVYEVSDFVQVGIETNLEFEYTIVSDSTGNEIPSYGVGASVILGMQGDVNGDGEINVVDIVLTVNFAIYAQEPTDSEFWAADINEDGTINVLDIVSLVNIILDSI